MSSESKRVLEVVMKTCPVCGLDVEDSYLFCPDDGAKLIGEQIADTSFTPAPDTHFKPNRLYCIAASAPLSTR